jgi:methyl-accepting chemotaxis protein
VQQGVEMTKLETVQPVPALPPEAAPAPAPPIVAVPERPKRRFSLGNKFLLANLVVIAVCFLVPALIEMLYPDTSGASQVAVKMASIFTGVLAAVGVSVYLARSMTGNIETLTSSMDRLSSGDLSQLVGVRDSRYTDEIDRLTGSVNQMVTSLRDLVWHIKSTSWSLAQSAEKLTVAVHGITTAAGEVAQSMEQIARGAELQSELVEKTSGVIERMAKLAQRISQSAEDTAQAVRATSRAAQGGAEVARLAVEKIRIVFEKIERASEMAIRFGDKTREVHQFVEVITHVAQQTHLLALNATIEAARAGEAGRGFAVVADEVRKLAEGTGKSTEQIARLVEELGKESEKVVSSMREGIADLTGEREDLNVIIQSLENILASAVASSTKVETIAQITREQLQGAEEMVKAIANISQVTESNAASTEEVSAATEEQSASMQEVARFARELSDFSSRLEAAVSSFKL